MNESSITSVPKAASLLLLALCATAACADVDAADQSVSSDESELRALKPQEIVGTMRCGDTRAVRHSGRLDPSLPLRAYRIEAERGQTLDVRVAAADANAVAWITTTPSSSGVTTAFNDDASLDTVDARLVYTTQSASSYVVFRERNNDESDFEVKVTCASDTPVPPAADPFSPASCTGPQMTTDEAIAKLAGRPFREIASVQQLMKRTRTCRTSGDCGPWSAPTPATARVADGSYYGYLNHPLTVNFSLKQVGTAFVSAVSDISTAQHCPGCTPSGIDYSLSNGLQGEASLGFYFLRSYPHGSSINWSSFTLGSSAATTITVTNSCARFSVLSSETTEYAVLYRY